MRATPPLFIGVAPPVESNPGQDAGSGLVGCGACLARNVSDSGRHLQHSAVVVAQE